MVNAHLDRLTQVDGWFTAPRWYSTGEGPYTALAKICIANAMTARELCAALGSSLIEAQAFPVHGRSLLDMRWARGEKMRSGALLGDIRVRCLAQATDRWWRALASDRRLRFCPSCIACGFQSMLCQLDALTHCPVHGDTIVDACPACGAETPRYAITKEGFERPMICPHCETPYAPCWAPANPVGNWEGPCDVRAYVTMEKWVRAADALSCVWPDQASWMVDPTDENSAHNKRLCMFELLKHLCPGAPTSPSVILDIRKFDIPKPHPFGVTAARQEAKTSRRQIYKAIRRHYRAELGASQRRIWRLRKDLIWDYPHTVVMPANTRVSAQIHGFLCWRSRFEETPLNGEINTGRDAPLYMRGGLLQWPLNWQSCDRAWGHFAQLCLMHELSEARDLHEELRDLDVHRRADLPAWLSAMTRVFHRFGPARQAWPAALSCLVLAPERPDRFRQIVLVSVLPRELQGAIVKGDPD